MGLTTPRLNLPYPELDDGPADVPLWVGDLANALDSLTPFGMGPLSARPVSTSGSPGVQGRWYYATDTPLVIYFDTGTAWQSIGATPQWLTSGSGAPAAGTGVDGQWYIDTDTGHFYGPKVAGAWPPAVFRLMPLTPTFDEIAGA